jgi:transcription elongation factor GreB
MAERIYITPEGAAKLRRELNTMWKKDRPAVTQRVAAAAALGDRSENADYIYGKKQLREMDKRIRYLIKTLDNLEVVDRKPDDQNRVYFGAWVELEDDQGAVSLVRIVGADEYDPKLNWISLNSPVGRALLGKAVGNDVMIERPAGRSSVYIAAVYYEPPERATGP